MTPAQQLLTENTTLRDCLIEAVVASYSIQ